MDFNHLLKDIQESNYDLVREKLITDLNGILKANIISYYSGFNNPRPGIDYSIKDSDIVGLIVANEGLDPNLPLYLILNTPGGYPTATEGIVKFLRSIYETFYIIVPEMAMSAGTMLACSADKIYMTRHSFLGPIDPQFGGISAYNIKNEFDEAKKEMTKNPNTATYWNQIISKYSPAFYNTVCDAIKLSSELAQEWLTKYMFKNIPNNKKIIDSIVKKLNSNNKSHSRHFNYDDCLNMNLKVELIENNTDLSNILDYLVPTYSLTFQGTKATKIIENHLGKRLVNFN